MAFYKVEIIDKSLSLSPGSNIGLAYNDYKLYIFGGYNGVDYLENFQIFNIKSNKWEKILELPNSNRPSKRILHLCLYIPPNYFFVYAGVYKEKIYDDTYLFNSSTLTWEQLFEQSPGYRYGMCGTVVNAVVYVLGGFGIENNNKYERNLDDVWCFDYRSREWSVFNTIGDDKVIGTQWSCVAIKKELYCIGTDLYKICLLNTISHEWNKLSLSGTIPMKLEKYSFNINESGVFLLFGGVNHDSISNEMYSLEKIDNNYIWHKLECTGNAPSPRHSHSSVCIGDILLILGGRTSSEYYNTLYAFNPNLGLRWLCLNTTGDKPTDRVGHISSYVQSLDTMFVHGGDTRGTVSDEVYLFNYIDKKWNKLKYSGISPKLAYHSCVYDPLRTRFLIFGGGDLKDCYSDVHEFNTSMLEWNKLTIKKSILPRAGHSAWLHPKQSSMIVFGGFIPIEGYTNELWSFEITKKKWIEIKPTALLGSIPVGRISCTCTTNENSVYMIGGVNSEVVLDDLWKLDMENWVWEKINIFEKTPGSIYGHTAVLVETHIFVYTGDSCDINGDLIKVPTDGVLWSLDLECLEWSRYKVEGHIPPKRFHTAVLVTNDILIYGGGPDDNVYQLDRNDVKRDVVSLNVFQDFFASFINNFEIETLPRPNSKLDKPPTVQTKPKYKTIDTEEEEKLQVFGSREGKKNTGDSSSSGGSLNRRASTKKIKTLKKKSKK
jgi:Kelch motif/Galactose oxidase, central domain